MDTPARRSVSEVNTPTVEKEKLETTDSDKKSDQVTAFDKTAVEEKAEPDLFEDGMMEHSTLTHHHLPVRKNTETSNIVFLPPFFAEKDAKESAKPATEEVVPSTPSTQATTLDQWGAIPQKQKHVFLLIYFVRLFAFEILHVLGE